MNQWTLRLLGEFSIVAADGEPVSLPGKKHQAMLAYVASQPEKQVARDKLLDLLWGSRSEGQARQSLRGVLSETKKTLRAHSNGLECESPLQSNRTVVSLSDTLIVADIDQLANFQQSNSKDAMLAFMRNHSGEFLENLKINEASYQDWRTTEAERYRRSYRELLQRLLTRFQSQGGSEEQVEIAEQLLAIDVSDEIAHRALMANYARDGNHSLAIRQYEICKQRLQNELGVEPSAATEELLLQIKSTVTEGENEIRLPAIGATSTAANAAEKLGVAIAIRPFSAAESDSSGTEYGVVIAEEIVSAASCIGWFRVVPRNESFKDSLASLGPIELSSLLDARYIVEGRLRKIDGQYALTIDLTDGKTSDTVWSERFVIDSTELPYPNDVVAQITGRIDVHLRITEIGRINRLDREKLNAYELSLLALSNMYDLTPESFEESERLFQRGVAQSPDYSTIHSFWCLWKNFCVGQSWAEDPIAELTSTAAIARRAIRLDPANSLALAISGHFESYWNHDFRQSVNKFQKSLDANPYSSIAWMLSSATYSYMGQPDEALKRLRWANHLCPVESPLEFLYSCAYSVAYNFNRDYELAMEWSYKTINENPGFTNGYKLLLVALGHLDQTREAQEVLGQVLRLDSAFNIRDFLTQYPFKQERDRENFRTGLIRAGVPEVRSG